MGKPRKLVGNGATQSIAKGSERLQRQQLPYLRRDCAAQRVLMQVQCGQRRAQLGRNGAAQSVAHTHKVPEAAHSTDFGRQCALQPGGPEGEQNNARGIVTLHVCPAARILITQPVGVIRPANAERRSVQGDERRAHRLVHVVVALSDRTDRCLAWCLYINTHCANTMRITFIPALLRRGQISD